MTATLIDGVAVSKAIRAEWKQRVTLLKEKGVEGPKCWADLVKPEYKGEVQVANPNSSGTAYTMLATLVQIMGEEDAFAYLKKLNENINQYTKSGAAPSQAASRGETLIGITFQHDLVTPAVTSGVPGTRRSEVMVSVPSNRVSSPVSCHRVPSTRPLSSCGAWRTTAIFS